MANVLQLKRSITVDVAPTTLVEGELAANVDAATVVGNLWLGIEGAVEILVATQNLNTLAAFAFFLDTDAFTEDSATQVASQQSIKAYADGKVAAALYDANSTVVAVTDDTPVVQAFAASTVLGRRAAGDVTAITYANLSTDLGIAELGGVTHNFAAAVAPTVNDDVTSGYGPGSIWIDTTADKAYICLDGTDTLAVWTETTQAGGGVDVNGTPASNEITMWFDVDTIKSFAGWKFDGSDMTIYEEVNDGNPSIALGKDAAEVLLVQAVYDGGLQTLDRVDFITKAASVTTDKGLYRFSVDEVAILDINDAGIDLVSSMGYYINGTLVLSGTNLDNVIVDGGTY